MFKIEFFVISNIQKWKQLIKKLLDEKDKSYQLKLDNDYET
jgi:hypothetical protein